MHNATIGLTCMHDTTIEIMYMHDTTIGIMSMHDATIVTMGVGQINPLLSLISDTINLDTSGRSPID